MTAAYLLGGTLEFRCHGKLLSLTIAHNRQWNYKTPTPVAPVQGTDGRGCHSKT